MIEPSFHQGECQRKAHTLFICLVRKPIICWTDESSFMESISRHIQQVEHDTYLWTNLKESVTMCTNLKD